MIKLYKGFVGDLSGEEYAREYARLTGEVKTRLDRKNNEDSRRQSLLGLFLLRKGVKELFGKGIDSLSYTQNGKPTLDFCKLSIAHTGSLVVCAFSDTDIGIDAEQKRSIKRAERYPFFTPRETDFVNRSQELFDERFLEVWTRKEAYVKMLGGTMFQNGGIDVLGESAGYVFTRADFDGFIITVCEAEVKKCPKKKTAPKVK